VTNLSIDEIKTDGGTQARAGLNRQTVMQYRQIIRESDARWPFADPLIVYHDGENHWLADGFHRLTACREQGKYTLEIGVAVDVRQGTRRRAVLHAVGANAVHGLQRTDDDKRRAVETLLRDEEWGSWSDREIARHARVSHPFVAKVRRELHQAGELGAITSERTYTTRHGTTAVMKTENIGGNGAVNQPEKTLYERLEQHVMFWTSSRSPEIAGYKSGFAALQAVADRAVGWKLPFTHIKSTAYENGLDCEDSDLMNVIMGTLEKHGYSASEDPPSADLPFQPGDYALISGNGFYLVPAKVIDYSPAQESALVEWVELGDTNVTRHWIAESQLIAADESVYLDRVAEREAKAAAQPEPDHQPEKLYLKVWHLESWVNEWLNDINGDDRQLEAMKSGLMDVTGLMMYIEEGLIKGGGPRRHYRKRDIMQAINNVLEQIRQVEREPGWDDDTADLVDIPHPFTTADRINNIIRMAEQIVAHSDDITVTRLMGTAVSHMYAAMKAADSKAKGQS